jgi:hypothetical protein
MIALLTSLILTSGQPTMPTCEQLGPVIKSTLNIQAKIGCNDHGCAFTLKGHTNEAPRVLIVSPESKEAVERYTSVKLYVYARCTAEDGVVVNLLTNFPGGDA